MTLVIHSFRVHHPHVDGESDRAQQIIAMRPLRAELEIGVEASPDHDAPRHSGEDDSHPDTDDEAADEEAGDVEAPGSTGLEVQVVVEAFDQDDRSRGRFERHRTGLPDSGPLTLTFALRDGPERVRFTARLTELAPQGDEADQGSSETPEPVTAQHPPGGSDTLELVSGQAYDLQAHAVAPPSIYEELRLRSPAASSGQGAARALDHVARQLETLPEFFGSVFDRAPYTALPGEIGADGRPRPANQPLASWQREVIENISGLFYQYSPKRNLQNLHWGIGYPGIVRCNTLTDLVCWLRGMDPPNWNGPQSSGVGFNSNGRSVDNLASKAETWASANGQAAFAIRRPSDFDASRTEPTNEAFVHDFRRTQCDCGHPPDNHQRDGERHRCQGADGQSCRCTKPPWKAAVDTGFRAWSYKQIRPGSVLSYAVPMPGEANKIEQAHINVCMRMRRLGETGRFAYQLFDTGAIPVEPGTSPNIPTVTLVEKGKAMAEEVWRFGLTRDFATGKTCVGHSFIPASGDRHLPTTPLAPYTAQPGGAGNDIVTEQGARQDEILRSDAERPYAHLAILRRRSPRPDIPSGEPGERLTGRWDLVYLSRPLRLGRPLTHLVGSVSQLPDSEHYQARWFVKLRGTWQAYDQYFRRYTAPRPHPAHPPHCGSPVVEVYNHSDGVPRQYRPEKFLRPRTGYNHLWEDLRGRIMAFYRRDSRNTVVDHWDDHPYRNADWDRRLGAILEAPAQRGGRPLDLHDAVPLSGDRATSTPSSP